MTEYVWCKNDECRIPSFRCVLCRQDCYDVRGRRLEEGAISQAVKTLRSSGKFKECFLMKRKDNAEIIRNSQLSFFEKDGKEEPVDTAEQKNGNIFLLDNGRIEPFSEDAYTSATLYQAIDSFSVECKLVRPEDPGNMVFEGKKPSRKTVPILVGRSGECTLLNSWEELESDPSRLADTEQVLGALPVKQVFVLKRK
jgi:hypothetical protein